MESCAQCDGEFRTVQGLRGHERYKHSGGWTVGTGRIARFNERMKARLGAESEDADPGTGRSPAGVLTK